MGLLQSSAAILTLPTTIWECQISSQDQQVQFLPQSGLNSAVLMLGPGLQHCLVVVLGRVVCDVALVPDAVAAFAEKSG